MERYLDVAEDSNPIPTRFGGSPVRVIDRKNAILALEPRETAEEGAPDCMGSMLAHMLRDGYYRVEIVRMKLQGTEVERAQDGTPTPPLPDGPERRVVVPGVGDPELGGAARP